MIKRHIELLKKISKEARPHHYKYIDNRDNEEKRYWGIGVTYDINVL